MQFVTFEHAGTIRAGVLKAGGEVFDLGHPAASAALDGLSADIMSFVEAGLSGVAARIAETEFPEQARLAPGSVRFCSPLRPHRIFGIGTNYHGVLAERGLSAPDKPVLFMKEPATVIDPGASVALPEGIGGVTYEAELAVIIGSPARAVSVENALEHIAGYVVFNDISASECIRADGNFQRGKNFPGFGPLGPVLVSADEVADPQNLEVVMHVDGIELQRASTSDMVFGVADLIARLSQQDELRPGDMIATGTPAGGAGSYSPPAWLRSGQTMSASINGLGQLINQVA